MEHLTARRVLAGIVGVGLVVASGCSGDDADGDEASRGRGDETRSTTTSAGGEPTCENGTLDGRTYILCTPGDSDSGLVVALHGRGSSAQEMRETSGLDQAAARAGFAVVFPDGQDGGWGDDTFATPARPRGDEDVVFIDNLVETLQSDRGIDDGQVGVVGFSNGASMAMRYAVERPDAVRAVVAVAGQLPRDPALRPTRPVSLMVVYGTADPVRSHEAGIPDNPSREPGQPTPTLPTADTVGAFVDNLDAPRHVGAEESNPNADDSTRLRTERWASDEHVVVLHTIVDGGHTWPSSSAPLAAGRFGAASRDLDGSTAAVDFIVDPTSGG